MFAVGVVGCVGGGAGCWVVEDKACIVFTLHDGKWCHSVGCSKDAVRWQLVGQRAVHLECVQIRHLDSCVDQRHLQQLGYRRLVGNVAGAFSSSERY